MIRRQIIVAIVVLVALTAMTGIAYPLVVTGVAKVVFPERSDGSFVGAGGRVVGSRLIGQPFSSPRYFHGRPSAAGDGYDATASAASNLGPNNPDLIDQVRKRTDAYRAENGLATSEPVPIDAVTASASGLDPEISPANAIAQIPRVAAARGLPPAQVEAIVESHTRGRRLGFLGESTVNVLELNIALDDLE